MVETNHARFIKEASQQKYYVAFADPAFEYVSSHTKLTANEKLIWLNIARKVFRERSITCVLTYAQIAKMTGVSVRTVIRAIQTLKQLAFLQVEYDQSTQLITYSIDLPTEGLASIDCAPNRLSGEGRKVMDTTPAKFEGVPPDKLSPPPMTKCTSLINIINNIKNHNIHNLREVVNTTEPSIVKNANALFDDYQKRQKHYSHLPVMKRIQAVNSHFTEEEQKIIHTHILEQAKASSGTALESRLSAPSGIANASPPSMQVTHLQSKLVNYKFENEHYLIEEEVKNQILGNIPQLYQQGKLKGEAGTKSIKTLMSEILFYATKAGSIQSQPISQLKRYYVARKLCMQGEWERPHGMAKREIIAKEKQWQDRKRNEIKTAAHFMGALSC